MVSYTTSAGVAQNREQIAAGDTLTEAKDSLFSARRAALLGRTLRTTVSDPPRTPERLTGRRNRLFASSASALHKAITGQTSGHARLTLRSSEENPDLTWPTSLKNSYLRPKYQSEASPLGKRQTRREAGTQSQGALR